jgi:hypothetical protein
VVELLLGVEIVAVVGVDAVVLVLVAEVAALEAVTVTVLAAPEPQPVSPTAASTHAGTSRRFIAGSLPGTVRARGSLLTETGVG